MEPGDCHLHLRLAAGGASTRQPGACPAKYSSSAVLPTPPRRDHQGTTLTSLSRRLDQPFRDIAFGLAAGRSHRVVLRASCDRPTAPVPIAVRGVLPSRSYRHEPTAAAFVTPRARKGSCPATGVGQARPSVTVREIGPGGREVAPGVRAASTRCKPNALSECGRVDSHLHVNEGAALGVGQEPALEAARRRPTPAQRLQRVATVDDPAVLRPPPSDSHNLGVHVTNLEALAPDLHRSRPPLRIGVVSGGNPAT